MSGESRRDFFRKLPVLGALAVVAPYLTRTALAEGAPPEAAKDQKETMLAYATEVFTPRNLLPQGEEPNFKTASDLGITRYSADYKTPDGASIVINYNIKDSDGTPLLLGATRIEEGITDPNARIADDTVNADFEANFTPLPEQAANAPFTSPQVSERRNPPIREKVWESPDGIKDSRGIMVVGSTNGSYQAWISAARMFPGSIQAQTNTAFTPTPK